MTSRRRVRDSAATNARRSDEHAFTPHLVARTVVAMSAPRAEARFLVRLAELTFGEQVLEKTASVGFDAFGSPISVCPDRSP